MTVVVAFYCTDGVVIAADSMLTGSLGNIPVGHHTGRKVHVLGGDQVLAFAGDQGLAARFQISADSNHQFAQQCAHPMDYAIALTTTMVGQYQSTGLIAPFDLTIALGFTCGGTHHCCMFMGQSIQPWLMDAHHFYMACGSGKLAADPFLRFLVDTFCQGVQPSVHEALLLATWAVEHVIRTTPGGVAGPIRIATLEQQASGALVARNVPDTEIDVHRQAVSSAENALRQWRNQIQSGAAATAVPPPPRGPGGP